MSINDPGHGPRFMYLAQTDKKHSDRSIIEAARRTVYSQN